MSLDSRLLSGISVITAIVDAGSFVGAGNALGLTQSGVSRAIQRLEQRLGARLFERNAKVVRLTETGKRFLQEVVPLMSRLEEAAEQNCSFGDHRTRISSHQCRSNVRSARSRAADRWVS
jgi:DNA-binding transcriptional LysR family regulator